MARDMVTVHMPRKGGRMSFASHQTRVSPSPLARGFTLVELMVTLAVIAILAVVAMPSMTALVNNSRLSGQAEELAASIQLARAEAVRRNARVTICASTNGTTCASSTAWSSWIIHGMDNTASPPVDEVIRGASANSGIQVSGPAAGIVFRPSGLIDSQASITACMPTSQPAQNQRVLTVMISGVVSTSRANGGGACP